MVNLALLEQHVGQQVKPVTNVEDLLLDQSDFLVLFFISLENPGVVVLLVLELLD